MGRLGIAPPCRRWIRQRADAFDRHLYAIARLHGSHSRRGASKDQVPGKERHDRGDIAQQMVDRKDQVARSAILAKLPIEVGFQADAGSWIDFVGHERTDGTKGIEALGARPLPVLLLQIARGDVVGQRVAANIAACVFFRADLAASFPITMAISPSKSTRLESAGMRMASPGAMIAEGGLRKSSGSAGTSLPSSAA